MTSPELDKLVKQITDEVVEILAKDYYPPYWGGKIYPEQMDILLQLGAARIGSHPAIPSVSQNLAPYIDHTLLKPEVLPQQVEKICQEAKQYGFASVCINPCYVKLSADLLRGSAVKVCTVIGFPLGATTTPVKAYEAQVAVSEGAQEVDMVISVGALKSGGYSYVEKDIAAVVAAVPNSVVVKVILETALLNDEEKIKACELAKNAGADFVKTSTGFGPGGATAADVALMRKMVGNTMGVKASGGIRDQKDAELMIKAGASRIGASASVRIVSGKGSGDDKY